MEHTQWQYLDVKRDGRIMEVSFRSNTKVNSLNHALMLELTELANKLQFDSELNAIIGAYTVKDTSKKCSNMV